MQHVSCCCNGRAPLELTIECKVALSKIRTFRDATLCGTLVNWNHARLGVRSTNSSMQWNLGRTRGQAGQQEMTHFVFWNLLLPVVYVRSKWYVWQLVRQSEWLAVRASRVLNVGRKKSFELYSFGIGRLCHILVYDTDWPTVVRHTTRWIARTCETYFMPAPRAHMFQHVRVVPAYTETQVLNVHKETFWTDTWRRFGRTHHTTPPQQQHHSSP